MGLGLLALGGMAAPAAAATPTLGALLPLPSASGSTSVDVPVTCDFGSDDAPHPHLVAHVTVTAPTNALPLVPYTARFRVQLGITASFAVARFATSSTYGISGPVSPTGTVSFHEADQAIPAGGQPVATTFSQTFTPALAGGDVAYRFTGVSYDFGFGASDDEVHASCTLDGGPVTVRTTHVL